VSAPDDDDAPNDDTAQSAKAAAILGGVFALVALGTYGTRAACSVLVGACIAVANLLTMRAIIRALVRAPEKPETPSEDKKPEGWGSIAWGLFAGFKILILFGGVWILLTRNVVDPMPLVVGYGVLPLGITASALWSSLRAGR
jgi:ATP synthase I chain